MDRLGRWLAAVVPIACSALPVLALLACTARPALADTVIGAKLRCQAEYPTPSDLDAACERGVDLASRTPHDLAPAMTECARNSDAGRAAACRRGISLHARLADAGRGDRSSSFSYSWSQGHGAAQVEIGNYDVVIGDAERSAEQCMRAFEGSKYPPSCASGIRVQPKSPADAR